MQLLEGQDSQPLDETSQPVGCALPLAKVLSVEERVEELVDQLGSLVLDAGNEGREAVCHGLLHLLAGGSQGVDQPIISRTLGSSFSRCLTMPPIRMTSLCITML